MTANTTQPHQSQPHQQPPPTLEDWQKAVSFLHQNIFYILAGMGAGALLGVILILLSVPHWQARMIIKQAPSLPQSGLSGSYYGMGAGQSGSLGGGHGFVVPARSEDMDFVHFRAILRGRAVAQKILEHSPESVQALSHKRYFYTLSGPNITSAEELAAYLSRFIHLLPLQEPHFYQISYNHPDPAFAVRFLTLLHHTADQIIREEAAQTTDQRIAYLTTAITRAHNPDHGRSLAALLTGQEHIQMLLTLDDAYAAPIVEKAHIMHRPVWPARLPMVGLCMLAGIMAALAIRGLRSCRL